MMSPTATRQSLAKTSLGIGSRLFETMPKSIIYDCRSALRAPTLPTTAHRATQAIHPCDLCEAVLPPGRAGLGQAPSHEQGSGTAAATAGAPAAEQSSAGLTVKRGPGTSWLVAWCRARDRAG